MSQVVLKADELDSYVRDRVETVLIGKGTKTTFRLHLPDEPGSERSICPNETKREGGWRAKDFDIFPPGYHKICLTCVRERFGVEVER